MVRFREEFEFLLPLGESSDAVIARTESLVDVVEMVVFLGQIRYEIGVSSAAHQYLCEIREETECFDSEHISTVPAAA